MNSRKFCLICLSLITALSLASCGKRASSDTGADSSDKTTALSETEASDNSSSDTSTIIDSDGNTIPVVEIDLSIVNETSLDLADISYLDPTTGDIISTGGLYANEQAQLAITWPKHESNFTYSVYDSEGNPLAQDTADVSDFSNKITIRIIPGEDSPQVQVECE